MISRQRANRGYPHWPESFTDWGYSITRNNGRACGGEAYWGKDTPTRIRILKALIRGHYDEAEQIIRKAWNIT